MGGVAVKDRTNALRIGDRVFRQALVVVDDQQRAVVVVRETNGTFTVVARGTGAVWRRDRGTRQFVVSTAEGEEWYYDRAGGCGCGSPFKRFDVGPALAGEM